MRRLAVIVVLLIRTASRGLQTSPVPSALATGTIALALLLVGAFALVLGNLEGVVEGFRDELQVVAYLDVDLGEREQRELQATVEGLPAVASAVLVTREEAYERFQATLGGAELLAGLDDNPLPASLEIELDVDARTEQGVAGLSDALAAMEGVDELAQDRRWVEGMARVGSLVRAVALVLGAVLVGAALLIVANTIRLAIYSREDEIEILSLVGAGRVFQRAPFILEGLVEGAVGGALALGALYLAFQLFLPRVEFGLALLHGAAAPEFFAPRQCLMLVGAGAALGALGSGFALMGWRR